MAASLDPAGQHTGLRLLIIEDEQEAAAEMAQELFAAGCHVEVAADGNAGLRRATEGAFDVLVVDRMLPGLDGLSLVAELRRNGVQTPVLFLTAMGGLSDRVSGLEQGGDDYLVKPCSFAELKARVNALGRRSSAPLREPIVLSAGDLVMDRLARTVRRADAEIDLLPLEFKLLEFMLLNAGALVTRTMLLQKVWGFHFDPRTNIVETHLSRLRTKLDHAGPTLIHTIRGAGYRLSAA